MNILKFLKYKIFDYKNYHNIIKLSIFARIKFKNNKMNHYETVFILNPVLSEEQTKETVLKYEKFLTSKGAKMVSKEDWGLKKLAYPIQNKKSGFYHLFEYTVDPTVISDLELEFRRDERFMRYLTVKLDKHAVEWAEKRRIKINTKEA